MKKILCALLICLLAVPALAETVQDQALMFIQDAGIAADGVNRIDNEIIVTLAEGGTASLWTFGDFDPFDLNWYFDGAADADVARYLDHALGMLAKLEAKIPGASEFQAQDYAAMVSNSLLYLEQTGEQGLRILLEQLSAHDDTNLNSLRARLASRLLGNLDNSPVDPKEGLAWYDALEISVQDDLPLPDASVYVEDEFLAEVTQLMIAHEEIRRKDYDYTSDVDCNKATTFVYLSAVTARVEADRAVVFCHMVSEKLALYNGTELKSLAGSWVPRRIDLTRADGKWAIARVHVTGDGTDYWPSIVAFCDGDEVLASTLTSANTPELHVEYEAARGLWLASAGYPDVSDATH